MTTTTPDAARRTLRIGHSPDPDDAFMWYPLANFPEGSGPGGKSYQPVVDTGPYDFVHILEDIQSLNDRAEKGELEITAISIHQYPFVADRYALTSCGSSMGDGYGPMLVAGPGASLERLLAGQGRNGRPRVAIPGWRTSAWLAMQLYLAQAGLPTAPDRRPFDVEVVMFDQIIPAVLEGRYDAGLIIHEGQLTYQASGLQCLVDVGRWWTDSRGLPLPLGGNAIRRDLGDAMPGVCRILLSSIEYALAHREASIDYALNYARDMGADLADRFVGMYVNDWTLDYGDRGRQAVTRFLTEAADAGLTPRCEVDFVAPA